MVRRTTRFGKPPKPKPRRVGGIRARPKKRPTQPTIRPVQPVGRTLPVAFGLAARNLLGVPEERIAVRGVRITRKESVRKRRPDIFRTGARGKKIKIKQKRPIRIERAVPRRVSLDPFERSGITQPFTSSAITQAPFQTRPRRPTIPPRPIKAKLKKIVGARGKVKGFRFGRPVEEDEEEKPRRRRTPEEFASDFDVLNLFG